MEDEYKLELDTTYGLCLCAYPDSGYKIHVYRGENEDYIGSIQVSQTKERKLLYSGHENLRTAAIMLIDTYLGIKLDLEKAFPDKEGEPRK